MRGVTPERVVDRLALLPARAVRAPDQEVAVSFGDAVRSCLTQFATFSGRARRSEFWWFYLFTVLAQAVGAVLDAIVGTDFTAGSGLFQGIVGLALLLPMLAVSVRRLHDTSRSGWWILIGLVPIVGWIVLLVFYVQDSHPDNQHGPSPKATAAAV
jgi:uncharacterized membrane protein YhaH (DUF805 family)